MMIRLVFGLLCWVLTLPAAAQFSDDFSDGNFSTNPNWTGTSNRWIVADLDANPALQSNGTATSDTLFLATSSAVSHGTWAFTFAHRDVNLSNFNGVRVFLMADDAELIGAVRGYFLQLGTNNSDEVRLYRQDGDPASSSNRVLLGASPTPLLEGDNNNFAISVTRSEAGNWEVSVNGEVVITTDDATYSTSTHFGVWVKHTQAAAQGYFFDDFVVSGDSGPDDITPPTVTNLTYLPTFPGLFLDFSEPISRESVQNTDFVLSGIGNSFDAFTDPRMDPASSRVTIDLGQDGALPNGDYDLMISGLTDVAGNVLRDTTLAFTVFMEEDTTPPSLASVEAQSEDLVSVRFTEHITTCRAEDFEISNGIGVPFEAGCAVIPEDPIPGFTSVELGLAQPLVAGITYTLTVRNVADNAGNVLEEASLEFVYFDDEGVRPQPGEVVINEISYDPPESNLEFIELLNLTDRTFNLADLSFSDDRRQPVPLVDTPMLLAPNGYAVLVQDATVFSTAFPDVPFLEPASWPALNNSGDAVLLFEGDTEIDGVFYDPAWGGDGVSLERRDPTGPSNTAVNWGSSEATAGGTPGAQNSLFAIDNQPPQPLSVTSSPEGAMLTVIFDEPLAPSSVQTDAFSLNSATSSITSATLEADEITVSLGVVPALGLGTFTLVMQNLRDLKGNTLDQASLEFTVLRGAVPQPMDLVINEIMYDPSEGALEYVEVLNRSAETFDLRDFTLADNRGQPTDITNVLTALAPNEYTVLVQDGAAFQQAFPNVAFLEVAGWPTLNNSGDAVVLAYFGSAVDSVAYASSWGGADVSLERIDPAGPSNTRFNWGSAVDLRTGTPGQQNSIFMPDLLAPVPVFAEQFADDEVEVFFTEPLDPGSLNPDAFRLDDGRTPRFTFLQGENESVLLRFNGAVDGFQLTLSGLRDLRGNAIEPQSIPIAFRPQPGEFLLNEIMFDPLADDSDGRPNQPEYVELINASDRLLSARRLYWTDVPDENAEADTLNLGNAFVQVPAGGFAVIFANDDPPDGSTTLAEAFPSINFSTTTVALLPLARASLSLTNSGDLIRLHHADDGVLDEVFYDPDWHNPNLRDATGVSLERISPTAPTDDASNWTSSVTDDGGTPGLPNSVLLTPTDEPQGETGITIAPSPFSPDNDGFDDQTRIQYSLSTPALVRARIFDARGRLVRTLEDARLAGRTGELIWDGLDDDQRTLRMGIYVVLFEALDTNGGTAEAFKETVVLARPF